jgi:hypothetical protein
MITFCQHCLWARINQDTLPITHTCSPIQLTLPFLIMSTKCATEIFYDFSCQLEEFCLNREPAFFRNTRFFHDIFHGFSHKCPNVYTSKRISALDIGVNSEICEQFNSYIQRIKYSARSMNQSHFVFFLQYFINIWNERKEKMVQQEYHMAQKLLL